MKRLLLLTPLLLGFAACGSDDTEPPTTVLESPSSDLYGESSDWQIVTDPNNGRVFHCLYVEKWDYRAGGPAIWCYEP